MGAVLDALGAPAGAEDSRTHAQRYHDALQEAMRRLLAAGLLPERAGQPVKALVHVSLAGLMLLDGSSALTDEWIAGVRAQWAAARAAARQDHEPRPVKARKRCRGEATLATGISGAYWRGSRPGPMTVRAASRLACQRSSAHTRATPVAAAMSHV